MIADASGWQSFYLMTGGAAAALTGLILIAISLPAKAIMLGLEVELVGAYFIVRAVSASGCCDPAEPHPAFTNATATAGRGGAGSESGPRGCRGWRCTSPAASC